jgi:hypothetical protein
MKDEGLKDEITVHLVGIGELCYLGSVDISVNSYKLS